MPRMPRQTLRLKAGIQTEVSNPCANMYLVSSSTYEMDLFFRVRRAMPVGHVSMPMGYAGG